ncbi:MAG: hypothetical protein D6704_08345 [Nitrospirae bacterium]|nr:MAG: hypothetical protein D6704_08345 [Nitrospirota bacterium]
MQAHETEGPTRRSPEMQWYLVNTKPRAEKLAEFHLQKLGVETFNPQIKQHKVIRRKRRLVISPLFPSYLFVRFDPALHYRMVHYATGVRKVVSFGETLARVEESLIEGIKARLHQGYVMIAKPSSFQPGQRVRIHTGPLQGLEAVFEREMDDRQRVALLLQTVAYQARVVVPIDQISNL